MNIAAQAAWDAGPSHDLEAERLFLSALIVSGRRQHSGINGYHFHDPFHSWLCKQIRVQGRLDLICVLSRQCWIGSRFAVWVNNLMTRRDGTSCSGQVSLLRSYASRLKEVRRKREQYERGQKMMMDALK